MRGAMDVRGLMDSIATLEAAWPETSTAPLAVPRVALKIGLLTLGLARANHMLEAGGMGQPLRAGPGLPLPLTESTQSHAVTLRRLQRTLALLGGFRDLLVFGTQGVGDAEAGKTAWLNWAGEHASDAHRQVAWIAPAEAAVNEVPKAVGAGRVEEWEIDTAMLHLGISLRDLQRVELPIACW